MHARGSVDRGWHDHSPRGLREVRGDLPEHVRLLLHPDGQLRVAVTVQGALVDVGAAHQQVGVVHDHQLGVHVDHVAPVEGRGGE